MSPEPEYGGVSYNSPVLDTDATGRGRGVCPKCRYPYLAVTGKLTKRYSKQLTIQRKTTKQRGIYKREYELRVDLAGGGQEIFAFEIDGKEDRIKARRGDQVTVLATTKGSQVHEVLLVDDHTMGQRFVVNHPGAAAKTYAGCTALVVAPVAILAVLLAIPNQVSASIGVGLLVGALSYLLVERTLTPRVSIAPAQQRALEKELSLRTKRETLLLERAECARSIAELENAAREMESLLAKMESVGEDVYQSRMATLRAALPRVQQLIEADRALVGEYDKAITIIEIEEGSRSVAAGVEDGALSGLEDRLDAIEEARLANESSLVELRSLEEVERLLGL